MTNAELIANIKAEIEYNRQRAEESVPKDLEEAAGKYQESAPVDTTIHYCGADEDVYFANRIVDAFIAGAKWQEQHDAELIEIAYNDGITIGMTKQKEQMMQEAVEGEVESFSDMHPEVSIPLNPTMFKVGEKVRVIILPKED